MPSNSPTSISSKPSPSRSVKAGALIIPSLIELKAAVTLLNTFDDDCLLTGIEEEKDWQPLELVKLIVPVLATLGTVAVICMLLFTVNKAGVSPNLTEVVPVKLVPVIIRLLFIAVELLPKLVKVGTLFTVTVIALLTAEVQPVAVFKILKE